MMRRFGSRWNVVFVFGLFAVLLWGATGPADETEPVAASRTEPSIVGPAQYRTGTPDPRVQQVPEEITQGVFVDPDQFIGPLAGELVDGARDDFHKVKILHDWIAENIAYDVESYFSA